MERPLDPVMSSEPADQCRCERLPPRLREPAEMEPPERLRVVLALLV